MARIPDISAKEIAARAGEQLEKPGLIERKTGLQPGYLKQLRASHSGPRYHLIAGRVVLPGRFPCSEREVTAGPPTLTQP